MSLRVAVVYALTGEQRAVTVQLPEGATAHDALVASALHQQFPDVDFSDCAVGIWGKSAQWSTLVRDQDRVEIYRPLVADPKESRRRRARHRLNQRK